MRLVQFFGNEDGQMSFDWTVIAAAVALLSVFATTTVSVGMRDVTDEYDGIETGTGMMTMFAGRNVEADGN